VPPSCSPHPHPARVTQAYAHDTAHEKIIRGLALGLALTGYSREEGADALVEQMSGDQVGCALLQEYSCILL
jgi:26S proteasome regulatory subunit N2